MKEKSIPELLRRVDAARGIPWHRIVMFGDTSGHIELATPACKTPVELGSFCGRRECVELLERLANVCPTCKRPNAD